MATISKALKATVQKMRELYESGQSFSGSDNDRFVAISSRWIPIHEALQAFLDSTQPRDENQQYEDAFEMATLTNQIVTHPHVWGTSDVDLGAVYRQLLDPSVTEVTEDLLVKWREARTALDLNTETLSSDVDFLRTYIDSTPHWTSIDLSENQFDDLIREADQDPAFTAAYQTMMEEGNADTDELLAVKRIQLDIATINVVRPWMKEELLSDRRWRFRNGATINGKDFLSDSEPARAFSGALPGYPVKLILVRNIRVTFTMPTPGGQGGADKRTRMQDVLSNGVLLNFGPLLLKGAATTNLSGQSLQVMSGMQNSAAISNKPVTNKLTAVTAASAVKPAGAVSTVVKPSGVTAIPSAVQLNPIIKTSAFRPRGGGLTGVNLTSAYAVQVMRTDRLMAANLALALSTVVTGTVRDANGQALPGAQVTFRPEGSGAEGIQQVTSQNGGQFTVKLQNNKRYRVVVSKAGYQEAETSVNTGAKVDPLQVKLTKLPTVTQQEVESDVQLLAIVYRKLARVPNPVNGFTPAI